MLEINGYEVTGFKGAIHGMRNPLNSWNNSDSYSVNEVFVIGEKDMKLAKNLIKAGSSDRKFLRMIHVQVDVLAPLYWWKEADQYKVGTTTNSCSTMHTIHKREFTVDDFSHEKLLSWDYDVCPTFNYKFDNDEDSEYICTAQSVLLHIIYALNHYRNKYLKTKDKTFWWQIIQLLPSSYNQLRTWDLDYETLLNIYFQRRNHKLDEWHVFCDWIKNLPYMDEFIEVLEDKS